MPARELKVGDTLLCEDGVWRAVEEVGETGEWQTVYNVRVADFHTYFVGEDASAVWAHNVCAIEIFSENNGATSPYGSLFRNRDEAYAAAREFLGIPKSLSYVRTWQLVSPTAGIARSSTVLWDSRIDHQGVFYEFNLNGRYVYIVDHNQDHKRGKGHLHIADGDGSRLEPGENYRNLGLKRDASEHLFYL